MARSLDRASLETLTSTDQTYPDSTQQSGLPLSLDATSIPHVHFSTVMPPNENIPLSQAPPSLQPHTDLQLSSASSLEDGSGQVRTSSDIAQMLASLQSTGELTSFLQQQPALLQGILGNCTHNKPLTFFPTYTSHLPEVVRMSCIKVC